jgi:hypothetical protein
MRPEVLEFLRGADHIVHGGDIGKPEILRVLAELAPLTAVRGNNDCGAWAGGIDATARLEVDGVGIYAIHELDHLDIDPLAAGVKVIVYGHSHKPAVEHRGGVLYVNPGSAGPRRFRLPIAAGELVVDRGEVTARIIEFPPPQK